MAIAEVALNRVTDAADRSHDGDDRVNLFPHPLLATEVAMANETNPNGRERRRHTRFKVMPMYSFVTVRRGGSADDAAASMPSGHVYDISEGGVRFELDEPLPEGERVAVEISLPGCDKTIAVSGKVVRVNDVDDDPGPRRMALMFESFANEATREALRRYLRQRWLERAA
ncbi:MAG: PilZ domain-containing protein [Phycisphaerae bacterium]|nr:PilZ domain-containing protein [Phycisphaerae bacterium]